MSDLQELTAKVIEFRDERDWKQFHNAKDVAISLALEASELLEHFQWKNEKAITQHIEANRNQIGEELADVLYWVLLMSHDLELDIGQALTEKLLSNATKYPLDKAKGSNKKYTQLES